MEQTRAPLRFEISGDVAPDLNGDLSVVAEFWEDEADLFPNSSIFRDVIRYGIHRGRLRFGLDNVRVSLKPGTCPNEIPVVVEVVQTDTHRSGSSRAVTADVNVAASSHLPGASLGGKHGKEKEEVRSAQYSKKFYQVQLGGSPFMPFVDYHAYGEHVVLYGQFEKLSVFALAAKILPACVTAKLVAYPKDILLTDVPSWLSLVPLARSFLTARLLRNFENDGSGKVLFSLSTMLNGAGPFKMIEDGGGPAHAMKEALALPESARGLVQTLGPKQIREAVEALELDFAKDLRGTNLSNIDLTGADLRGFDLERADLRNSTLSHARLEGANLSYADLEGAKVSAVFTDHSTVFQGARFMNAQVEGISRELLKNARLGGAILEGVKIGSARDLMLSATDADMRAIAEKSVADARASTSFIRVMKTEEVESSIGVPSREFPFCYDDADLREVANVMRITALDSITVVDRSEKVVGMIKNSVVAKSIDAKVR